VGNPDITSFSSYFRIGGDPLANKTKAIRSAPTPFEKCHYTVNVLATRPIWIILLYAACILSGAFAGLLASAMIIKAAAGSNCCAPGDGIGMFLCEIVLIPLGVVLGTVLASTILRISRQRAANNH
jgi:hypothetical protein